MKALNISRKALVTVLRTLKPLSGHRSPKPILSNVRVRWDDDGAWSFASTDLEVTMVLGEHGPTSQVAVLPLERLLNLAKDSKAENVSIEATGDFRTFLVTVGESSTRMMGEDPEEYPVCSSDVTAPICTIEMTAADLKDVLLPRFAVAKERSRFAFNGMRLQTEGLVLVAVGTDGKRMAVRKKRMLHIEGDPIAHIVPLLGLKVLDGWLKTCDQDDVVKIHADSREVVFQAEGWVLRTRLVDGAFPKYESVIPKDTTGCFTFDRVAFIEALKKAQATTNDECRSVKLIPDGTDGLIVHSRATDVGETNAKIPVRWGGLRSEVCFNPDFLTEGLKLMSEERLTMELTTKDCPAMIRSSALTYVVMPVTMRAGSEYKPPKMKPVIGEEKLVITHATTGVVVSS